MLADMMKDFALAIWPRGVSPDGRKLKNVNWREIADSWLED